MYIFDWYQQNQAKKEEQMKDNEIFLINQDLKRLLQQIQSFINREDYKEESEFANRYVVQSSIWDIRYQNNMKNEQVALAQAVLIYKILGKEDIPNRKCMAVETERLMRRLGNIELSIYSEYRRAIQPLEEEIHRS